MPDTYTRARGPRASLVDHPYPPLLFDNWAVCARCMPSRFDFEGVSERDGHVWFDHANASYRCREGHTFTASSGTRFILWETEER